MLVETTYRKEELINPKDYAHDHQDKKIQNPISLTLQYDVVCCQLLVLVIQQDTSAWKLTISTLPNVIVEVVTLCNRRSLFSGAESLCQRLTDKLFIAQDRKSLHLHHPLLIATFEVRLMEEKTNALWD